MKCFVKLLSFFLCIFFVFNCLACGINLTSETPKEPVNYTVEFDSKGGSTVLSQSVTNWQKAVKPDNPTKTPIVSESYSFAGWYTSPDEGKTLSENSFDFETPITSNITLYAKWTVTPITYTVSFNPMGGNAVLSQTITGGQKATKPEDPTKTVIVSERYIFAGWYTSTDEGNTLSVNVFDFNTTITSDITLYAKWTSCSSIYIVSFNPMDGGSVSSQTITGGHKATRPEDPTKKAIISENYSFAGWYTSPDEGKTLSENSFNFETPITSNITLYAKWTVTPITYTVSFNPMGGNAVLSQTITGGQKAIKPEDPTKKAIISESYSFAGWYTSTDEGNTLSTSAYNFDTPITSEIILYAKWTVIPITYTVSFNSMGGSSVSSQSITGGQKAERPENPIRKATLLESYSFVDWYTSTDEGITLSTEPFDFNTTIISDIKLYAKWNSGESNPLAFEFINDGSITITNPWTTLKYSINGETLTSYTNAITVNTGDKVYLFAQKSESESMSMNIKCSSDCYIYGNIMSLVTMDEYGNWNPDETRITELAFCSLFTNNTHILNHNEKELYMPSTTLANHCYHSMFSGCTGLTKAPNLPATMLANFCYESMFAGCTGLTIAPALPATTLADYCYWGMFYGCTSLTKAPALPATTLAIYCYRQMFSDCTGLTEAPALPATTLTYYCYSGMFYNCTGLTEAPALPATTLAGFCYCGMFSGCTGLTKAPNLPVTTLVQSCYSNMFSGCTSLTTAPVLPASILTDSCYYGMFYGCTKLKSIECLATDISAIDCTNFWLDRGSSTGTFTKAKDMTDWVRSSNGIPSGWTVVDKEP